MFFLGLLMLVQACVYLAVNAASIHHAHGVINEALLVAASVFHRQIEERSAALMLAARLLSSDFAFKEAFATHERATILSALENHRRRIGADVMLLLSMEGEVIADTPHPRISAHRDPFAWLLAAAEDSPHGEATGVVFLDSRPYQMVVVPLFVPMPAAWVCTGFGIGDEFAARLQKDTFAHVSLAQVNPRGPARLFASTLPGGLRERLPAMLHGRPWQAGRTEDFDMGEETYVSLVTPLVQRLDLTVVAVLQRSLAEALAPYTRLSWLLGVLFMAGALLSMLGAVLIARTVTRPVLRLVAGVRRIEEGNYTQAIEIRQRDELGELAVAFNRMGYGLAERDRVRDLLGKVVSPAVARELMARKLELGGEECEVSILFSDLRNFTELSENRPPRETLALLNHYFTQMSAVVERHGGVVDKYIGDGLMALYGAPLAHADHAARAVGSSLEMYAALGALNVEFAQRGWPCLDLGIGVNTARVVVGNMGSQSRLNYTVIGDGVNLASRLEGLTKIYGVPVVVADSTQDGAPDYVYRELDRVRVKGKKEVVAIYQPLGRITEIGVAATEQLAAYREAMRGYRAQRWSEAKARFAELALTAPADRLYSLYLERIERLSREPPGGNWDSVFVDCEK